MLRSRFSASVCVAPAAFACLALLHLVPAHSLPAQVPGPSGRPADVASLDGPRWTVGASTLLGIPMLGRERPLLAARRAFQWDVMVSPWRSVDGYPLEFVVGTAEWRWYRRASRTGPYGAMHVGAAAFRLRRPDYRDTTLYQEGAGLLGGVSVGYLVATRRGWRLDAYLGGGTIQSLYKGYDRRTQRRYDGAKLWNVSGEWWPYRIGVQVAPPPRRHR